MATPYTDAYVRYDGNGVTTEFSIDFDYEKESEIKVYIKRGSEAQITLPSSDYSFVTKNTLKFPASGSSETVLAAGDVLAIQRESEFASEYVFDNQRRLEPVEVMNSDDNLERQIQELKRDVGQAIRIQPTSNIDTNEYFIAVESVYENIENINTVAGISGDVVVCSDNIEAIIDAPNQASAAAQYATEASQSAAESMASASDAQNSADAAQEALNELTTTATEEFNANAAQKQAAVDASAAAAAQSATNSQNSADAAAASAAEVAGAYISAGKVSGSLQLQNNKNYHMQLNGSITFIVPSSVDENIVNQVMLHIWMPSVVAINWGYVSFVNGEAPDVSTSGGYFVYYQKIPFGGWLVGAYKESA